MKFLWPKFAVLAMGLLFLAGCATDLRISGVTISITDIRPLNATVFETQAAVTLRYINESVVPIAVSKSSHKLYFNGSYVGKAVSSEPVGLPSMKTGTQTVTMYIENLALLQKLQGMAGESVISYQIDSVLYVEAGEAYDNVKVRSSGQLDLSVLRRGTQVAP
jgi:LEA14-like dessication related protein